MVDANLARPRFHYVGLAHRQPKLNLCDVCNDYDDNHFKYHTNLAWAACTLPCAVCGESGLSRYCGKAVDKIILFILGKFNFLNFSFK